MVKSLCHYWNKLINVSTPPGQTSVPMSIIKKNNIPAILIALMNNLGNDAAMAHQLFGVVPSPFFIMDIVFMFIVVQQIDNNFITPILVGESVGLHPMAVMIVLFIGGTMMGPLGMLFAIPAAGVLKVIISEMIFISKNSHLL